MINLDEISEVVRGDLEDFIERANGDDAEAVVGLMQMYYEDGNILEALKWGKAMYDISYEDDIQDIFDEVFDTFHEILDSVGSLSVSDLPEILKYFDDDEDYLDYNWTLLHNVESITTDTSILMDNFDVLDEAAPEFAEGVLNRWNR